jgi:N-acetylmuramic acid 6-phosphate etherase
MNAQDLVKLFIDEEKFVEEALRAVAVDLARAVELVADSLRKGGRLYYVGAGTSGRLGVLDASEIPSTFGASPDLVQGIIAGGTTALHRSVEGAEDETSNGSLAIDRRGVKGVDVVIGITASGRTPFVLGALTRAKSLGAKTVLLTCNPVRESRLGGIDLAVDLVVGPEILTGSTRLKAGTATKIALNIISTGAMVSLGKVRGNLMIDLNTTSSKLRDRATRMVADLTESDYNSARAQLEKNDWDLRAVLKKAGK